jgi:hypothetical protein
MRTLLFEGTEMAVRMKGLRFKYLQTSTSMHVSDRESLLLFFKANIKISPSKLSGKDLTAKLWNEGKINIEKKQFSYHGKMKLDNIITWNFDSFSFYGIKRVY